MPWVWLTKTRKLHCTKIRKSTKQNGKLQGKERTSTRSVWCSQECYPLISWDPPLTVVDMRSSPENSAGKNWGWNMMDCGTTKPVQTQNTNSSRIPPSRLLWWTGSWCVLFCCFFRPRRKIFPRIGFKMFQENSAGNNDNLEGYCTLIYCTLFCGTTDSHYFTVHVDPLPLHIFGDPWHLPAQSRTTKSFCRSGVSLAKLFDILQFMCTQSYIYIYMCIYVRPNLAFNH